MFNVKVVMEDGTIINQPCETGKSAHEFYMRHIDEKEVMLIEVFSPGGRLILGCDNKNKVEL